MTIPEFKLFEEKLEGTILIEASAGTGKTFTLAWLVVRLVIEQKLTLREIVAVTFTKAAAAELKERIGKFIHQALRYITVGEEIDSTVAHYLDSFHESRQELITVLETAELTIDEASIYTIHGFCQRILNDFAFESGAELGRELITSQEDILEDITHNFWRSHVLTLPPEEYRLVTDKIITSPDVLRRRISPMLSFPNVEIVNGIQEKPDLITLELHKSGMRDALVACWNEERDSFQSVIESEKKAKRINGRKVTAAVWNKCDNEIQELIEGTYPSFADTGLKRFSSDEYPALSPEYLLSHPVITAIDNFFEAVEACSAGGETLAAWIEYEYAARLNEELHTVKEARNQSSFDDIIRSVYRALSSDNRVRNLFISLINQRYNAVMVDEFQDTDLLQYEIFKTLFNETLFCMIGDPKQAIYRFRGGDVSTYLKAKTADGVAEFTLNRNFRSEATVIDALNYLFKSVEDTPFLTKGIPYIHVESSSDRNAITHNSQPASPVVISSLPTWIIATNGEGLSPKSAKEMTCNSIADECFTLLNQNWEIGSDTNRKRIEAGDIAVLVNGKKEARGMKEALNSRGIPAVTLKTGTIYSSREFDQVVRIMEAVSNPGNSRFIRGVLIQEPFSYNMDQIENELIRAMARFAEYLSLWRERGVAEMLDSLFTEEEIFAKQISSTYEGVRPLTNYRHIFELIHSYESEHGIAPIQLISHLKKLRQEGDLDEYQQRLESDDSAVNIVTVHSSKGLEYPVVFLPFGWAMTTAVTESSEYTKIHHPLTNSEGNVHFDLSPTPDTAEALRELDEENQRLFYVALTRASQRLYLYEAEFRTKKDTVDTINPIARFVKNIDSPLFERRELKDSTNGVKDEQVRDVYVSGAVREFSAHIKPGTQTKSYSSIVAEHGIHPREKSTPEPGTIFAFPKGARTGNAWHRIFEVIDYTKSLEEQEKGLIRAMEQHGFSEKQISFDCVRQMVVSTLNKTLEFHEGTPFSLSEIHKSQMMTEMAFHLRADRVDPLVIQEIINRHESLSVAVKPDSFTGFLQGFIDLIFRHNDRYYILDWKSNHLGNSPSDYTSDKVDAAMEENEYRLQYILYTVAVTRFLQRSLSQFDYDRHIGGAYYVFLRGVNENGSEGFYYHLPKKEMILELLEHFQA